VISGEAEQAVAGKNTPLSSMKSYQRNRFKQLR
jgi:hypothetical protein